MAVRSNRRIGENDLNVELEDGKKDTLAQILQQTGNSCQILRCDCDNINTGIQDVDATTPGVPGEKVETGGDESAIDPDVPKPVPPTPRMIYVISPTYTRATQMADMTRLAQTLQLASIKSQDIFWIVSEDATERSEFVSSLLVRTGLPHVHLLGPRPATHRDKRSGRGVSNRLKGLEWLRQNFSNTSTEGVVYFADDDNSYDIRVFDEMRQTQKISVWPVGLLAKIGVSSPVISSDSGRVIGFHDPFTNRRKFAVDMAGFAFDLQLFLSKPKATMPYKVGYEEDYFIRSLGVSISDLEPRAENCTQVSFTFQLLWQLFVIFCNDIHPCILYDVI